VKNARFLILLAVVLCSLAAGCATTEPENVSERPWNAPKSWENGLPGGMMPNGGRY
jgi:hypothetical protein